MKHLTSILLLTISALHISSSAGVFNAISRARIAASPAKVSRSPRIDNDSAYIPVVLEISGDDAIDSLLDIGAVIFRQRQNFIVCCIPESRAAGLDSVQYILSGKVSDQCMSNTDILREFTNVNAVHNDPRHNGGYDGTGVVTGFCDIGFDPGHIAFRDRVPLMVDYTMRKAIRRTYSQHNAPLTDRDEHFHATHVANIMAGSRQDNPYYGVAPGATIIATTSDLYDAAFLCGIEDVIDYARDNDMPAVINLSVGNQLGPRDGTDVVNRYLDLLGKEAIICFSAGNSGSYKVSLSHTFVSDSDSIATFIDTFKGWNGMQVKGETDIWSADGRDMEISVLIYDFDNREFVYQSPWFSGDFITDLSQGDHAIPTHMYPRNTLILVGRTDKTNGRYNIAMTYDMESSSLRQAGPWSRYYFGYKLRGKQGVSFDAHADGEYSFMMSSGIPGMTDGNGDMSISNYACGHNVISVGSYNSRNIIPLASGGARTFDFPVDHATSWSGHGTLRDGRRLPDICAPGNYVISATSQPFFDKTPDAYPISLEKTCSDGHTYRWHGECGTSMSAPAAAGTFALWLQADPTLTRDRIVEIAQKTARYNMADADDPRWAGNGALDARAGLDIVINEASIKDIPIHMQPVITVDNGVIEVKVPGTDSPEITVFDIQGRQVSVGEALLPGIYIVRIVTPRDTYTRRIAVD